MEAKYHLIVQPLINLFFLNTPFTPSTMSRLVKQIGAEKAHAIFLSTLTFHKVVAAELVD